MTSERSNICSTRSQPREPDLGEVEYLYDDKIAMLYDLGEVKYL